MARFALAAVEQVAVLEMADGENRHDLAFARELLRQLDGIEEEPSFVGVVLTSVGPKHWSTGIDVQWVAAQLADGNVSVVQEFLHTMNRAFARLLTYPLPVVAAINGHVAGNGVILACACDFRLMRTDYGFCRFPEIDLGIPFLPGMIDIALKAFGRHLLEELKYSARRATADELAAQHVLTGVTADAQQLRDAALTCAGSFRKDRTTLAEMKRRMNRHILRTMADEDPAYIADIGAAAHIAGWLDTLTDCSRRPRPE